MSLIDVERALTAPAERVGDALLTLVEGQYFDRKSIRITPAKVVQSLLAMANADGGTVVVGLSDGEVEGVDHDPRAVNAIIRAAVELAVPPVRMTHRMIACINGRGEADHLLCLQIEPDDVVHASTNDDVYLRVADSSIRLTRGQREQLLYDKGQMVFEATRLTRRRFADLDPALVQDYARQLGAGDAQALLERRGMTGPDGLSVAGYLLFSPHPQDDFPYAHVRVVRFLGRERGLGARQNVVSDERVEGPLPSMLLDAARIIDDVQPRRRALGASRRFEEVPLVPGAAWLEGLVNAVVHRSYSHAGDHIRVEVFDDRIEIESPGRFPGVVDLQDVRQVRRFARNPRIARVLADLNFGQEFGEGIARMFEEMHLAGLEAPRYVQTSGAVRVVLSGVLRERQLDGELPPEARAVVEALREAGRLGTGELSTVMGLSRPATIRRLSAMQALGVITRVGQSQKDPRAYWTLTGG